MRPRWCWAACGRHRGTRGISSRSGRRPQWTVCRRAAPADGGCALRTTGPHVSRWRRCGSRGVDEREPVAVFGDGGGGLRMRPVRRPSWRLLIALDCGVVAGGRSPAYGGVMAGATRRALPHAVASAVGLVVAAAVFTVVACSAGWHADKPDRLRAVLPAVAAAVVATPVLPSRLPDLAGAPAAPAAAPALTGRLRIVTRPVVAPLARQVRGGHTERGPPAVAPTS
jgi:hypothetical protein